MLTGVWTQYKYPFNYYQAHNVLDADRYNQLTGAFGSLLAPLQTKDLSAKTKHTGGYRNYDALMLAVNNATAPLFNPFFSDHWIKGLYNLLAIPFLGRIDGALHSHPVNSRTGWIHTDFCSAWFDEKEVSDAIMFPDRKTCEYFSGNILHPSARPVEYVRAATLIYYLNNDNWKPGYGGETAFYGSAVQTKEAQSALVPPINNSLILFECSPHSYHRFITNCVARRNSIIMWIHSPVHFAEERWGNTINKIKSYKL